MTNDAVRIDDLPVLDTDVVIIGAGPTGLMAGLVLNRRGVAAIVVDRKAGPTKESRALAVQARTMEIYDQLGLAERVLEGSYLTSRVAVGGTADAGGPDVPRMQEGATRFPGIHIFEQSRNEGLLADALNAAGADIRWQHSLIDLQDHSAEPGGRVEALLEGADGGLMRVRARWCIGADGASSTVRRGLNVPFEGTTDDSTFWVADVLQVQGMAEGALNLKTGKLSFAIAFPLGPDGHYRLMALAPKEAITQDEALAAISSEFGLSHGPVEWFSTYRVHHRLASKFRVGSIFLAGDAAHVHSPVGGQGMNTGLQDAHNLANLLADVALARLDAQALQRYERERRPVAKTLVNVTDRAFGVIGRSTAAAGLIRKTMGAVMTRVLPLTSKSPIGARIGGYLGQYRIRYHYLEKSPRLPEWASDPAVGRRLPPVGDNQRALTPMTWQLHTYGPDSVHRPDVPAWIEGPHAFSVDEHGRLRPDRLYLIRPDQFVAASIPLLGNNVDTAQLHRALTAHLLTIG